MSIANLFMVREHFKAGGVFYPAGTVLTQEETVKIPLIAIRLGEKKLVRLDIPEPNIVNLCEWVKARYGADAKGNLLAKLSEIAAANAAPVAKTNPTPGTKAAPKTTGK